MEFPCVTLDQAKEALFELKDTKGVLLFHAELDIPPALTVFFFSLLKVSNFQKQMLLFSFEQKTERNYCLIPALRIYNGSNEISNNPN